MYFPSIISTTLLSLSLFFLLPSTTHATPTPSLITTRDSYLTSITFPQLAHIASFRANLTDTDPPTEAQSRALELMQTVVAEFATDKLDEAEKACVEAFGRDVCFERITANYLRHDWGLGGGVKVDAVAVAVAAGDNWFVQVEEE
ncbi:hypothetical protein QBC47DRAFT_397570 [Echria macrotheca]|uniref:Uncharacterized protein n=1 Tax=Echria macrotheca TaxID=438768 RepID=A0AAJ0FF23_9PEZI|nr:hypothetical protein QBC47DRAFT_397570 [Echria macrotheca]